MIKDHQGAWGAAVHVFFLVASALLSCGCRIPLYPSAVQHSNGKASFPEACVCVTGLLRVYPAAGPERTLQDPRERFLHHRGQAFLKRVKHGAGMRQAQGRIRDLSHALALGRKVCPWATREGRAREGPGAGCGAGRGS